MKQSIVKGLSLLFLAAAACLVFAFYGDTKAEAYDGCTPSSAGKYAVRNMNTGTVHADYQSGAACKLTICVASGKVAAKVGPPACGDAANPLCGFPIWFIGYELWDGSAPSGTPPCDPYWNSSSRWVVPAN